MLPDRAATVRLDSVGTLRNGVNFNQTQEGLGIPVLKVKDFGSRFFAPDNGLDELDPERITIAEDLFLRAGDAIVIRSNGNGDLVGRCLFVPHVKRPTTFSGFCIRFRPEPSQVDPRYASYLLRSPYCREHMVALGSGTGIQNINQDSIGSIGVALPTLDRQRAIAAVLGCLDDKIALNFDMNRELEELAGAIFKSWFVEFDPVGAKRDGKTPVGVPADAVDLFPSHFEDSELGPIPKGWRVAHVEEAFDLNPRRNLSPGVVAPYLEMANVPTVGHSPDTWIMREAGSGMRFTNGDTLMARITPCLENGKTAFVDFLAPREIGWGSTEFLVMRSKPPLPLVASYLLARDDGLRAYAIQGMTGSSGRQRVAVDVLGRYALAMPDDKVAKAFGDIVEPLFEMARHNSAESKSLRDIRDLLLAPLLSGEITVKTAEKIVAEVV